MKQTLPGLANFEKSSDEIAKYFTMKYGNNYHVIRQLQNQRKQLETPLLQAKRTLRTIQQECDGFKRSSSRQSDRMKATSSSAFSRPGTQFDTFIQSSLDVNAATVLFQNLKLIMECLLNKNETPNFQIYWESVCEFKWEQYLYFFTRQATQKIIQESILLSDISIAFIQCQMKENLINNQQNHIQEMGVLSKLILESFAHFLNKILTYNKNAKVSCLQQKLDSILQTSNPCISFIQELKRNNAFMKSILEKLLQHDDHNIQPVIITCRYQLSHLKVLEITNSRPQLINAIYLSTSVTTKQEFQSPLKTLFKVPHQQQYILHLRASYSNLDNVTVPFISTPFTKELCVVLDLDETMGHFNDKLGQFVARPGLIPFLKEIKEFCEIIVFTAGLQNYADHSLSQLNCEQYIDHKLYRQHTTFNGNTYVKDLSKIGRPLERLVIIDNTANNFELQQDNGLLVSTWIDQEDSELDQLKGLLLKISKTSDVRKALRKYRDYISRIK